jgi:hypothetical protein
MPRDGLTFAILVRREIELGRRFQERLQLPDDVLLLGADDVQRLEVVVDVDAQARPRFALVGVGHVLGVARQIAHVTDRGLDGHGAIDDVRAGEIAGDRPCLGRRFHDH